MPTHTGTAAARRARAKSRRTWDSGSDLRGALGSSGVRGAVIVGHHGRDYLPQSVSNLNDLVDCAILYVA